jgi:hypothetical protein
MTEQTERRPGGSFALPQLSVWVLVGVGGATWAVVFVAQHFRYN